MNPTDSAAAPRASAHVFIATSLDGFIARADGGLDWLERAQARVPAGEDFGYAAFMAGIDSLVLGRASFDTVLGFDPWPYAGLPVQVLSHRGVAVPEALRGSVGVTAEAPRDLLERLHREGRRRVYVDGGLAIQSFLADGCVDSLTVTTVPVLLGTGRPLFGALPADLGLDLDECRHWRGCGFVQSRWLPRR
jgi:dihydrofolate reductase